MVPAAILGRRRKWLADQNITLLKGWPANSPDISPIEQIWGICKRFIIQQFGMRTPLTTNQLETAVFDAFERIEQSTINVLTLSVQFRIRLCIARNGKFVGDALEESCSRAKVLLETTMAIPPFPTITEEMRREIEEERGDSREPMTLTLLHSETTNKGTFHF